MMIFLFYPLLTFDQLSIWILYLILTSLFFPRIQVHAYSVDRGHVMGSWEAHDDAVSCTSVTGLDDGAPKLVTASWDCSVKVDGRG